MKKILLFVFLLPFFVNGQDLGLDFDPNLQIDSLTHQINYSEVVLVDSLSKVQIFTCAHGWIIHEFDLLHANISYDDFSTGRIIARGTLFGKFHKGLLDMGFTLAFDIIITAKQGKYKYEFTNFTILNGLTSRLEPDWVSADIYVNDKKYLDSKGHYSGALRQRLAFIDGNMRNIVANFKYAISQKRYSRNLTPDF